MQPVNYRKVLARNVDALMKKNKRLGSRVKLAKACTTVARKIGASTIGHLLNEDGPFPQLDTIIAVAQAFKVQPWQLLHQAFDVEAKGVPDQPEPDIIRLARRITVLDEEKRDLLLNIFSDEANADEQPAERPVAHKVHEPPPAEFSRPNRPHKAKASR